MKFKTKTFQLEYDIFLEYPDLNTWNLTDKKGFIYWIVKQSRKKKFWKNKNDF